MMRPFKATRSKMEFWFLTLLMLMAVPTHLHSINHETLDEVSTGNQIIHNQKDSTLFRLNLEYLNGVNDHRTPYYLISIIHEILEIDPLLYNHWFNLGIENIKIQEYYRAIDALNKGLELHPNKDNPALEQIYISLSFCYHKIHKHQKEKEILDFVTQIFPDHPGIIGRYAICSHTRLRYHEAAQHQNNLISVLRTQKVNESDIAFYLGRLFLNEDYLEAEKHFRVAYQYDPDNVEKLGSLAWTLIQNALRINEGMKLMEQALQSQPENAIFIHQQGYGYYMKGEYKDALLNLYKAQELYEQYSFELDNHIRIVEDAIAGLTE